MTDPDDLPIWDKWPRYICPYPSRIWFTPSGLVDPWKYWKQEYVEEWSCEAFAIHEKFMKEGGVPWSEILKWKEEVKQGVAMNSEDWDRFVDKVRLSLSKMEEKGADLNFILGCVVDYLWNWGVPDEDKRGGIELESPRVWQSKVKRLDKMADELYRMGELASLRLVGGVDCCNLCDKYSWKLRCLAERIRKTGLCDSNKRPVITDEIIEDRDYGKPEVIELPDGRTAYRHPRKKEPIPFKAVTKRSGPISQTKLNRVIFMLAEYNRQKIGRPMWGEIAQVLVAAGLKIGPDPKKLDYEIGIDDKKKWLKE